MNLEEKLDAIVAAKAAVKTAIGSLSVKADATDEALAEGEALLDGRDGMVYAVQGGALRPIGPFSFKGVIPPVAPVVAPVSPAVAPVSPVVG